MHLQLGNMKVFIHCVLDFSNHPDNNLKSWTGKVGSGSLRLRSDLCCPDAAADRSSQGAAWRQQRYGSAEILSRHVPHQMSEQVLLSFRQRCSQLGADGLLDKRCESADLKDDSSPVGEITQP